MDTFSTKSRSRRSAPALGALHITQLTREPLTDSPLLDDELAEDVRRSYISSRSLPQTPSILSRSSSRSRSRGHGRRNAKSALTLTSLDDASAFPRTSGGGPASARPKSAMASGRQTPRGRVKIMDGGNNGNNTTEFLLRTASLLVESASESKGQGWISKRNSTTSLTNYDMPESLYIADDERSSVWSRVDANDSRRGSVSGHSSRLGSRRESRVAMTSRMPVMTPPVEGYFDGVGPDLADEEYCEDQEEETIDEGELKRLLRRRVGGMFEDIFGGWFDLRNEDDQDEDQQAEEGQAGSLETRRKARLDAAMRRKAQLASIKKEDIFSVRPPSQGGGTINDARWLLDLARRALI